MTNKQSKDARESATSTLPDDADTVKGEGQDAADRERLRIRPEKKREPLHALIVHFDARGSSEPPEWDQDG
jgi:hypothetical protein